MLSKEENELLTQTDKGTPMGAYLRSFWIPCMVEDEIPSADGTPKRLRLLGEDLIVFRDSQDRIGVMEEHCPHRRASLYFGRNEECGIRCVYHGWKFDVDGNCLDMPSEPAESSYRHRVKAVTYPNRLAGGFLWVFMGDQGALPELPRFEWLDLPPEHRYATRWEQECNSIQAMEGELDPAHVSFLHRRLDKLDDKKHGISGSYFQQDRAPKCHVKDTPYGFINASERAVDEGMAYWRLNHFLLPFYTMIAAGPEVARMTRMWVPKDDTHCWVLVVNYRVEQPLHEEELDGWRAGDTLHRKLVPGTTQPVQTKGNDYLIDRQAQKTVSFTGIDGIRSQDAMVTESAGPIVDRSREHLGTSDVGIVKMRRRLLAEARAMASNNAPPSLAFQGADYRVRAAIAVLERGRPFEEDAQVMATLKY